jgi:ABC-type phosphate/phosphonate transport system substrate-binding protein
VLASLPMYDLVETRSETDGFWTALAEAYGAEGGLTRVDDIQSLWRTPELLFSQTCGYPFTHAFAGQLKYIATPHYAADGCEGPNYCSIIFAREAQPLSAFRNHVAAFNARDSASGMLALQVVFAPLAEKGKFFSQTTETGAHVASLLAVQQGMADVCAIDCVTVALLQRYRPSALAGLFEVGRSPHLPGLPYVTRGGDVNKLRVALETVFTIPDYAQLRASLLLGGFTVLPNTAYDVIIAREEQMQSTGGLELFSN